MARVSPSLLKALELDQEVAVEDLPGSDMSRMPRDVPQSVLEIATFLVENPLYVQPCRNWIASRKALIARSTLQTLYTPDEYAALVGQAGLTPEEQAQLLIGVTHAQEAEEKEKENGAV